MSVFVRENTGHRGGSRTVATSKMERFVIIVNGWKPLTIITKRSILDVAVVLDPSLGQRKPYSVIICTASLYLLDSNRLIYHSALVPCLYVINTKNIYNHEFD